MFFFVAQFKPSRAQSVLDAQYSCEIVMYFLCAFFTVWFASVRFNELLRNPVRSQFRSRKLREILIASAACLIFLVFHVFTTLVYLVGVDLHHLGFSATTVLVIVCEAVPSIMLLYILYTPARAQKANNDGFPYRTSEDKALLR